PPPGSPPPPPPEEVDFFISVEYPYLEITGELSSQSGLAEELLRTTVHVANHVEAATAEISIIDTFYQIMEANATLFVVNGRISFFGLPHAEGFMDEAQCQECMAGHFEAWGAYGALGKITMLSASLMLGSPLPPPSPPPTSPSPPPEILAPPRPPPSPASTEVHEKWWFIMFIAAMLVILLATILVRRYMLTIDESEISFVHWIFGGCKPARVKVVDEAPPMQIGSRRMSISVQKFEAQQMRLKGLDSEGSFTSMSEGDHGVDDEQDEQSAGVQPARLKAAKVAPLEGMLDIEKIRLQENQQSLLPDGGKESPAQIAWKG
ncbi:hypothetical protein CYMTET_20855, partial [Cymbomonas tetramitiformis]